MVEIIKASCSYVYLTRCKDCMGQCEFEGTESFAGKWVRLEDAEQEVKDATETLLARLIPLEQKVSILQKEREELKQKLEDAQKEISRVRKERDEMEELANDVANQYSKEHEELKQKLRQLLTEFPKKHWNEAFEWRDYATEEIDVWKKKFEELIQDGC